MDPQQPVDDEQRFQIELEFVQCLANPWYLNHLAQQQYFKDDAFIRYLEYLQYWKKPEYARFVVYPHALYFLDLLQHAQFREHITTSENTQEIHRMQYYHWMYLRNPPKTTNDNQQPPPSSSSSPPSDQQQQQQAVPQEQTPSSSQPLLSQ
ncbi:SOH1-domain-containing protein [Lichtheimia hyalospora FSU 10163]|nr:SOH1-domain-containing protein [Lichtheimia hyalospora FSU 10163]